MRQIAKSAHLCALAVILAQAGLPLPARSARIGIVDRLFSRVGAADDLARNDLAVARAERVDHVAARDDDR